MASHYGSRVGRLASASGLAIDAGRITVVYFVGLHLLGASRDGSYAMYRLTVRNYYSITKKTVNFFGLLSYRAAGEVVCRTTVFSPVGRGITVVDFRSPSQLHSLVKKDAGAYEGSKKGHSTVPAIGDAPWGRKAVKVKVIVNGIGHRGTGSSKGASSTGRCRGLCPP